jgi:TolA-binding protein
MTEEKKTPVEASTPAHHPDELAEIKQLVEKHGKPVVTGILIVMIAVGSIQLYSSRKAASAQNASTQLSAAQSIPDIEDVLENYSNTPVVPQALIALAKRYYDNANYEIAFSKYEAFISNHPDHRMLPTAQLGRIYCIEARNTETALQEAADAYAAFAQANPDGYLAPQALFGQGRCLEQLGQFDEARAIYEDFIAKQADSAWSMRAEDLLNQVTLQIEKAQRKAGTPAATPALKLAAPAEEATATATTL